MSRSIRDARQPKTEKLSKLERYQLVKRIRGLLAELQSMVGVEGPYWTSALAEECSNLIIRLVQDERTFETDAFARRLEELCAAVIANPVEVGDRSTGDAQLACDGRQIRDTEPAPPPTGPDPVQQEILEDMGRLCDSLAVYRDSVSSDVWATAQLADCILAALKVEFGGEA